MPWDDILKSILGMPGIHPALFLLVVGGAVWLALELRKSEATRREEFKGCSDEASKAFEKRLAEQGQVVLVMERTSTALTTLTASIEARTQPINGLVSGLAALVQAGEASRSSFKDQANRLEARQAEIANEVKALTAAVSRLENK